MTVTDTPTGSPRLLDEELTRRALHLVTTGTTDMAPDVLRVPLGYYRDPDVLRRERAEILEVTPLALAPSAQVGAPHDFVVREVLGRSVLISRGGDGVARAFLNYCRHRGARPAEGCGNARRFSCPYHAWTYDSAGRLVGLPGQEGFAGVNSPVGVEVIDILPADDPVSCVVRHGWMGIVPATDDDTRAGYEAIYEQVHAAVRDEDFTMLPSCGDGVRNAQHDHMLIGRNEIGVQHLIRTLATDLGIALHARAVRDEAGAS